MNKLSKTYPFQVFRHRIYIPFLNLIDLIKDKIRKVDTQKYIELTDLGIDIKKGSRYEAISYRKLKILLSYAHEKKYENFLDIGCGLGRPIIVANEIGFKNLYGVDISEKLISSCKSNLKIKNVYANLACEDVDNYNLPDGKLCIFLFNPFGKEKMKNLLAKIQDREFETIILYHNPKHLDIFESNNFSKKFTWNNFGLYEEKCFCYTIPKKETN